MCFCFFSSVWTHKSLRHIREATEIKKKKRSLNFTQLIKSRFLPLFLPVSYHVTVYSSSSPSLIDLKYLSKD